MRLGPSRTVVVALDPLAESVRSCQRPACCAATVIPRPSGVHNGRWGESPKDRRESVALAVSRIQRSDSASEPMRAATRRASGLRLSSRKRRGVFPIRIRLPSVVDPGGIHLPRGRCRGTVDEGAGVRQREVRGAVARIVAHALQHHLGRPAHRQVVEVEGHRQAAPRLNEEETARGVSAVRPALEHPPPLAGLQRRPPRSRLRRSSPRRCRR